MGKKVRSTVSLAAALLFLALLAGCEYLKASRPIISMKEYEVMLTGPLEADYIGNDNCLKACHEHDQIALYLKESLHGQQTDAGTGMPLVNCETCHGPGSLAVAHAVENKKCDTTLLVVTRDLPAEARSLVCLKCHTSYSMSNLRFWAVGHHAQAGVSCSDCHKLHAGRRQKKPDNEINSLCLSCHHAVRTALTSFSRHPMAEGKMNCTTCHNPHGSMNDKGLKAYDARELCLDCHGGKVGPFLFEHGGSTEGCGTCHVPHGSPFADLLRYQTPFLCLDCHSGHTDFDNPASPSRGWKRAFYTRCSNCHSQIHGTDSLTPRSLSE